MKLIRSFILFLSFILFAVTAKAEKEKIVTLKSVRGEYAVVLSVADITGRQAAENARLEAKRKALEQVCGVRINIWDQIETSTAGETFNSMAISQTDGEIVEFEIKEEGHEQSAVRSEETIFYCVANVKVKEGASPDPDFVASVSGVKSVYFAGDILKFTVQPHSDCYMKLFLLEDGNTGYLLYPNLYDMAKLLPAGSTFDISKSDLYEFELQKADDKDVEVNRLVFLFTKTERPFSSQITSRSEIEKWIATIPSDQKYLHFSVIEIRDN